MKSKDLEDGIQSSPDWHGAHERALARAGEEAEAMRRTIGWIVVKECGCVQIEEKG